jgi:hypothetical protein
MRARLSRAAFTTVELMIALIMGGIVAAGITSVLRRQQRFYTTAASLVEQRISLRDATGILPGELRALSPGAGDVLAFSDSSLEIRATIGTAIACDTIAGGGAIAIAPASPGGARLTSFTTSPQAGDVALVYDAGPTDRASDDVWISLPVADVSASQSLCVASPFVATAEPLAQPMLVRFTSASQLSSSVRPGAFVRVLRRVRYRFYRASTGDWYLGYAEWAGTAFSVVQPVSGPFASYSRRGGASGLVLRYFDAAGMELFDASDASRIARVSVAARSAGRGALSAQRGTVSDSQTVGVRVRNQ